MKKVLIIIFLVLACKASAQDTAKIVAPTQPVPATEKLYYFAFPASYVDALYNNIGVSAENNKTGISVTELRQMLAYQANNQPKTPAPINDSVIKKEKKKPKGK